MNTKVWRKRRRMIITKFIRFPNLIELFSKLGNLETSLGIRVSRTDIQLRAPGWIGSMDWRKNTCRIISNKDGITPDNPANPGISK